MNPKKADILAFGAHPDDVECAAAGVLLKHTSRGKILAIVDLIACEMGSYGNRNTGKAESLNAASIPGISCREHLGLEDGAMQNNHNSRNLVIQAIGEYQPEVVLCNAIKDRHPGHAIAVKLVAEATFLSGLKKNETSIEEKVQFRW